jgi:hypothetical protein
LAYLSPQNERKRYSRNKQCVKKDSGDVNGNSGRVNTDSGKMNSDSGHGAKSWYFPPEYAFTQNQKQRSRSARIPGHAGPEYAISSFDYIKSNKNIVSSLAKMGWDKYTSEIIKRKHQLSIA